MMVAMVTLPVTWKVWRPLYPFRLLDIPNVRPPARGAPPRLSGIMLDDLLAGALTHALPWFAPAG